MASTTYKLKRFTNSLDLDFASALLLYVRNTPANIRTDTNEISYWLDNFGKTFQDDFYVFGFYRNRQLVGFAEAAYFYDERLYALDYIVIDEANRGNNVFYEFVEQLKIYMENTHPDYRYGIAEVTYGSGQEYPSQTSRLMVRLLKLQGFKIIRAPYYQPRLMLNDLESEMKSDLLIFSTFSLDTLKKETYLSIVETLYFKHYLRWKSIIPKSEAAYKGHLDHLYEQIKTELKRKQIIAVNGHQSVLAPTNKKPTFTVHKVISFSFQGLLIILLLTAALLGLRVAFNLSDALFVGIFILAISSFVAIAGIVSKEAREIFGQFVDLAKFVLHRRLGGSKPNELDKDINSPVDPKDQ